MNNKRLIRTAAHHCAPLRHLTYAVGLALGAWSGATLADALIPVPAAIEVRHGPLVTTMGEVARRIATHQPLFGAGGPLPAATRRAAGFATPSVRLDDQLVAVVSAEALSTPWVASEVEHLLHDHVPLLVLRQPGALMTTAARSNESATIARTLGMASEAELAYYLADRPGKVAAVSLNEAPGANSRARTIAALAFVHREVIDRLRMQNDPDASANAEAEYSGPQIVMTDYQVNPSGSSMSMEVKVVRNTTASRDVKMITATTTASIKPRYVDGAIKTITDRNLNDYKLVAPFVYKTTQTAKLASGKLKVQQFWPESTSQTDVALTTTKETTNQYSIGVSGDIADALTNAGSVKSLFKLGFNASYLRTNTTKHEMAMTLKDYSVSTSARDEAGGRAGIAWELHLLRDLWEQGGNKHPRRTPMMDQATEHLFTSWEAPGDETGPLSVEASVSTTMHGIGWYYDYKFATYVNRTEHADWYPRPHIVVDLGTPHLTKAPTVQLRSLSGNGACLREAPGSTVTLGTCDRSARETLWELDSTSRYVNAKSGQCLTFKGAKTPSPVMEACQNGRLDQTWEWQVDRIHSQVEGGDAGWRLFADGKTVDVKSNAMLTAFPVNASHMLLRPWAGYPLKPEKGDVIPVLSGRAAEIPESWLTLYAAAKPAERWDVIPVLDQQ